MAPEIVVVRCLECGDTFPVHEGESDAACPSCGGTTTEIAAEPLL